jgi:hypothetical protein
MKDKTVAILESRVRDQIAGLVRKYGGNPVLAPAVSIKLFAAREMVRVKTNLNIRKPVDPALKAKAQK